jgi:CheY-like chemotaxis protein
MSESAAAKMNAQSTCETVRSHSNRRDPLLTWKTELIGEIIEAMANEFNNIMMSISSSAEVEIKKLPARGRRSLEHIVSNAARATALVQKLVTISRKRAASRRPVDLNGLFAEMGDLLRQVAKEKISITFNLDPSNPLIIADPVEVEEAILSVVISARNALTDAGEIIITTSTMHLPDDVAAGADQSAQYVCLGIEDNGPPRSDAYDVHQSGTVSNLDSKADLFLWTVSSFVEATGGLLRYSAEPGKRNALKIYFPSLLPDTAEPLERSSPRDLPVARTILIVDDDEAVRSPAAEFLKMEGFKVLQARTGAEAIHVVLQSRSPLDILITDLVMPTMNGHEVAEKLLELHPDLKVLYVSGDADRVLATQFADHSKPVTLRKPFRLEILKDHIHELLGE